MKGRVFYGPEKVRKAVPAGHAVIIDEQNNIFTASKYQGNLSDKQSCLSLQLALQRFLNLENGDGIKYYFAKKGAGENCKRIKKNLHCKQCPLYETAKFVRLLSRA